MLFFFYLLEYSFKYASGVSSEMEHITMLYLYHKLCSSQYS